MHNIRPFGGPLAVDQFGPPYVKLYIFQYQNWIIGFFDRTLEYLINVTAHHVAAVRAVDAKKLESDL